ncbi:hypothetical protein HANVADRAFT_49767 [Hanseniaspora valbyensis NRRL Y-1626]|uniref:Uncharacterized protein n=1 Tax=Hanseniaspora valbyensis NRRL Y-1626 TaxID=766949 RepID=A0A1B7TAJ8_9ASCO|nr:hypothetical protein HANVADRAFT_49767 [Hanseniaspora valbyensis NRRL Y-1626]
MSVTNIPSLNKSIISGLDTNGNELTYSILFNLPIEIWLLVLSKDLDEVDLKRFFKSIPLPKFESLLDIENQNENPVYNELWKLIFRNAYKTLEFPNISKTMKDFKLELNTRIKLSNSWKHSKCVIHKYNLAYNNFRQHMNIFRGFDDVYNENLSIYSVSDNLIFDYPKVVSYNEGNITRLNVSINNSSEGSFSSKASSFLNKRLRFTYIPCISPSNCSFYKLYNDEIVFGNKDGNLYLKHFKKKAYHNPVLEVFDTIEGAKTSAHSNGISCIEVFNKSSCFSQKDHKVNKNNSNISQYIVSVDFLGNLKIWFINNKHTNESYKKIFELPTVTMCKTTHIFLIESVYKIILLDEADNLTVLELTEVESNINNSSKELKLVTQFKVKLPLDNASNENLVTKKIHFVKYDYGGNNLILTTQKELLVIRFGILYKRLIKNDLINDYFLKYQFSSDESIQNINIDEETSKEEQSRDLLGKDGCFITIITEPKENPDHSNTYVFNIRSEENLKPQIVLKFYEKCYASCINKLLLMVYLKGMLILYNALSGEELKIIKISTPPQSKRDASNDFNMLKTSKDKIILYGVYNNDLQFLDYNIESVKRSIENGKLKNLSKRERTKIEQMEESQRKNHGKKKGGFVKTNSEGHIDTETVYEYYENKQQEIINKKHFENFDIDLNNIDGLHNEDLDNYGDDELIQLKIALSESLAFSTNSKSDATPLDTERTSGHDLFGNPIPAEEHMTEEEQLEMALALSLNEQ